MLRVFLELENDKVMSCSSSPVSKYYAEVDVPDDHEVLWNPLKFNYKDGELIEDLSRLLEEAKATKITELNVACEKSILYGFTHEIDGVPYHFSFDVEAQFNFHATQTLFYNGMIEDIVWTVKRDGEYTRIILTKPIMEQLTLSILKHKNGNISKFRDFLEPLVQDATTIEEVESIKWDSL